MNNITVGHFYASLKDKLKLDLVAGRKGLKKTIKVAEINRPGLAFSGYLKYFAFKRIQIIGKVEMTYLRNMPKARLRMRIQRFLSYNIPCCIISRNYIPPKMLIEEAEKCAVPLFRSPLITMALLNKATVFLEDFFAPVISMPGDLLEVFGVGVLLKGESGIGKSESALSLIKRGHRLIADDAVKIKLKGGDTLVGFGNPLTRHHMEIRGIGIVNVQTLFGVGCIRDNKRIDLIINMEEWMQDKEYERLGLEERTSNILGIEIPYMVIPIRPGRDIALLVEVAALNQRLKWLGYHSARDFNDRLISLMKHKK